MQKFIISLWSMLLVCSISAQIPAPDLEWREFDHPVNVIDNPMVIPFAPDGDLPVPGTPQEKEKSGEDWWYDIIPFQDETQSGYVVSGFASWLNIRLDETIAGGLWPYKDAEADCNRPIMSDEILSQKLATVGKYDEDGNMIWCTPICKSAEGAMSIIHHNGGYVFTGWGKPTISTGDVPLQLRYNPRSTDPGYNMTDNTIPFESRKSQMFVGKLDENGQLLWINSYGYYDMGGAIPDEEVLGVSSIGYDLTVTADNEIRVVGFSEDLDDDRKLKIFIIDLDENGLISEIGATNKRLAGALQKNSQPREIEANADGTEFYITGFQHMPGEKSDAILFKIDENMDQVAFGNYDLDIGGTAPWNSKAVIRYGYPDEGHSIGWDVKPIKNGKIAWAFIEKCTNCFASGTNIGQGQVFLLNSDGITATKYIDLQLVNSYGFTDVRAFDMKMGLIATQDGGFACVTSIKGQAVQNKILNDIRVDLAGQIGYNCIDGEDFDGTPGINTSTEKYNYFDIWGTDAYISKFDANGDMLWDKSFDSDDTPIAFYPGDYKEQECVYRIAENAEGALAIVGNTSHNKDDYYIAKLESDCNTEYDITPDAENKIYISSDQVWDETPEDGMITVRGELHIQSGATLTIDGITVEFADSRKCAADTKVIIEQGAKLILKNGAVLTALGNCGDAAMWDGIEVWGNRFESQSTSGQGWLIMRNSTIEHAHVGVTLMRPDHWNQTGGVIQAFDSYFINNRKSIAFMSYIDMTTSGIEKPNRSIVKNTDFIWDNDFRHRPLNHVSLFNVYGVPFLGCHFSDLRTGDAFTRPYVESGNVSKCGIRSIDAYYIVNAACNDMDGCSGDIELEPWNASTFDNLDFGIYASNSGTIYPIRVERSIFTNNLFGIEAIDIIEPRCLFNKFYYSDIDNFYIDQLKCGIKLERSPNIIIEENLFENVTTSFDAVGQTIGIVCSNLGITEEMVRKNTFKRLTLGNLTEGANKGTLGPGYPYGSVGLSFECNTNIKNREDFKILGTLGDDPDAPWYSSSLYGIKNHMGSFGQPAGNVLSSPTFGHFMNESFGEIRYHYNPMALSQTPIIYSNTILMPNGQLNQCKSNYSVAVGKDGVGFSGSQNNSNKTTLESLQDFHQIDLLIQQSRLKDAQHKMNNLWASMKDQSEQQQQEIRDFITLKKWSIRILRDKKNYYQLSEEHKQELRAMAKNSRGLARYQAEEIACFYLEEGVSRSIRLEEKNHAIEMRENHTKDEYLASTLTISPNPSNGEIWLTMNEHQFEQDTYRIELFSIDGKILQNLTWPSARFSMDLSSYENGLYIIRIQSSTESHTVKVMKQ